MISVHTDGSYKHDNQGHGTGGIVVKHAERTLRTIHAYFGHFYGLSATVTEWGTVWLATRLLREAQYSAPVTIYSDLQEIVNWLSPDRETPNLNEPHLTLARQTREQAESINVSFCKVSRTNNHEADRVADRALKRYQDDQSVHDLSSKMLNLIDPDPSRMGLDRISPEQFLHMDDEQRNRLKNRFCSSQKHEQYGRLKMRAEARRHGLNLTLTAERYRTLHRAVVEAQSEPAYRCREGERLSSKRCWFRLTGPCNVSVLHNRRSDYLEGLRPL